MYGKLDTSCFCRSRRNGVEERKQRQFKEQNENAETLGTTGFPLLLRDPESCGNRHFAAGFMFWHVPCAI